MLIKGFSFVYNFGVDKPYERHIVCWSTCGRDVEQFKVGLYTTVAGSP